MTDTVLTKREEKSRKIRDNILNVSRRLFIQQGYSATTIRQILTESGITTGTLYHFFKDKDDILMQLAADHLDDVSVLIKSLTENDPDPAVFYALEVSIMFITIHKYDRVAELYLSMYRSWRVSDLICRNHGVKNRQIFGKRNKDRTDEWWYIRSLAITGIMQNCIAERLNNNKMTVEMNIEIILTAAFGYFNIPINKIEPSVSRAMEIIKKNKVGLYGVYI